ncbi:hypothetical protein [Paraburkholderia guartelaensis]|uniref:hypothetical protein n=1 Tax=Paraburkholderia guartelaensis TaxID=2546446 RepID=UPI002AB78CBB|nr:hypothetical protein [Paraburkholderia guartelaensis]
MQDPPLEWDTSALSNDSRAWFITTWPGKVANAPDAEMLFVLELPSARCLSIQLVVDSTRGWQHQALSRLASISPAPDILITDNSKLHHFLVSAGASFHKPATSYLDKPITLMPAIHQCILSLMELFNEPAFRTRSGISNLNEALESWRVVYNRRDEVGKA